MSWKVEITADFSSEWIPNALRFGTKQEADAYAADLATRWTVVQNTRSVWCPDPINAKWDDVEHVIPIVPAVA